MLASRLSQLTEWRPDPAALKNAARAGIAVPAAFAVATLLVGGDHSPTFAAFGSFALICLVAFGGRTSTRILAYFGMGLAGMVLIAIGTVSSNDIYVATAVSALVTFLIFFAGVVNSYLAAARNTAILMLALSLMIPAEISAIDDRLYGWAIAWVIAVASIFLVWRTTWVAELQRGCSRACLALADLVAEPGDDQAAERAVDSIRTLRKRFLATPQRPTGPTGSAAALAALIDELSWLVGQIRRRQPRLVQDDGPAGATVRGASADVLTRSAQVILNREATADTQRLDQSRDELVLDFTAKVQGGNEGRGELRNDLSRTFWLRALSFSVAEVARFAEVASGGVRASGPLGERWRRVFRLGTKEVERTEQLLVEHVDQQSVWLRNSLRGAIAIAVAVFVAELISAENAFWVVLGTLSVLRSNSVGTEGSVVSALVGTVVGLTVGSVFIILIGENQALLWIALPLSVFFAGFAPRAFSFGAGQAGFSVMVMVLFNLIEPIGVEVGLVRIEDIATGCAVSLAVGALMWPRGASELLRQCLGDSFSSSSRLVDNRIQAAIVGQVVDSSDPVSAEATAASNRLDAAVRQYLDESSAARSDPESLIALAACSARLRRLSYAFRMMLLKPWYVAPGGLGLGLELAALNDQARDWYLECSRAIANSDPLPEPGPVSDLLDAAILEKINCAEDSQSLHSALTAAWIFQALVYLIFLEGRVVSHADRLFTASADEGQEL